MRGLLGGLRRLWLGALGRTAAAQGWQGLMEGPIVVSNGAFDNNRQNKGITTEVKSDIATFADLAVEML